MFGTESGPDEFKSDKPEENVVFHYSREHRLESAPQNVRDAYNGNFTLNKGFRVLFKNRTNRFLLITLVVLTAFAFFYGKIITGSNKGTIGNYNLELTAFSFEDSIYSNIKISEKNKKQAEEREPVSVKALFEFYDLNDQLFDKAEYSILVDAPEKTQGHRITDYDISEVKVSVTILGETKVLTSPVKR